MDEYVGKYSSHNINIGKLGKHRNFRFFRFFRCSMKENPCQIKKYNF